jgi:type III secretory pathway component EscU
MYTSKEFQLELIKFNKLLIAAVNEIKKIKIHKAYFPLAKISSFTALLVLSLTFYCCQELSTFTQILCIKFVRHNLTVLPKYPQYLIHNR